MEKLKAVVIGAGNRAGVYSEYAKKFPEQMEIVAVADINEHNLMYFSEKFGVPKDKCFSSYEELLSLPKMADYAFICTQDKLHFAPAIMALHGGYHLLLEKPIAPAKEECLQIARISKEKNLNVTVCHVLRYTPMYKKIKEIVDSGVLGEITGLRQIENVGNSHMAHSFVRGNWHKEADSNPMIIAKCCHDLDIIRWIMGKSAVKVSSFGSLQYFNEAHAPAGAPKRCLDGCPYAATCRYYAPKVYTGDNSGWKKVVFAGYTDEEILEKLKSESNYGVCVYHSDNDVVDHQTVTMEYENGAVAELVMTPFRFEGNRETVISGTNAELRADTDADSIVVTDYDTGNKTVYDVSVAGGHFGGDIGLMTELNDSWRKGNAPKSAIDVSIESHLLAWAAEDSRHTGKTVDFKDYLK